MEMEESEEEGEGGRVELCCEEEEGRGREEAEEAGGGERGRLRCFFAETAVERVVVEATTVEVREEEATTIVDADEADDAFEGGECCFARFEAGFSFSAAPERIVRGRLLSLRLRFFSLTTTAACGAFPLPLSLRLCGSGDSSSDESTPSSSPASSISPVTSLSCPFLALAPSTGRFPFRLSLIACLIDFGFDNMGFGGASSSTPSSSTAAAAVREEPGARGCLA